MMIKEALPISLKAYAPKIQGTSIDISKLMLNLMSDYLHQNVEGLDTTAILILLEEMNNISNGNEARFIKSKFEGGGRPIDVGKNMQASRFVCRNTNTCEQ